ncbi:hypothetical protein MASR2M15_14570 [Anaerolineales bacterium]
MLEMTHCISSLVSQIWEVSVQDLLGIDLDMHLLFFTLATLIPTGLIR